MVFEGLLKLLLPAHISSKPLNLNLNLKGLGHFFLVAEALLRSAGNVPFGS